MKRILIFAIAIIGIVGITEAQTDGGAGGNQSPPQGPIDNRSAAVKDQLDKEDRVLLKNDELPAALRKALERDKQYDGWENSRIYVNRSTKIYMLHLTDSVSTRTFWFTENGKPTTGTAAMKQE